MNDDTSSHVLLRPFSNIVDSCQYSHINCKYIYMNEDSVTIVLDD
jgi:hypothetical protein